jgi:fatty acid desaturase
MTTLQDKTVRPDPVRVRQTILAGFVLIFGLGAFVQGFWLWSVPALAFAVPAAVYEFRRVTP